jgi:hypothetical protein
VDPDNPDGRLTEYLLNKAYAVLGFKDADELQTALAGHGEHENYRIIATVFLELCPEFPNTKQSIDALAAKIHFWIWPYTLESMIAAHYLCLREKLY